MLDAFSPSNQSYVVRVLLSHLYHCLLHVMKWNGLLRSYISLFCIWIFVIIASILRGVSGGVDPAVGFSIIIETAGAGNPDSVDTCNIKKKTFFS
jgi:hypothetical protein